MKTKGRENSERKAPSRRGIGFNCRTQEQNYGNFCLFFERKAISNKETQKFKL